MAKLVFGPVVSDARNKIGGVVFTKSRSGAVARRKVSPVQPRSSAQVNVRASLTDFSKQWSGILTAAQRAAWIAFASNNPVKDVFGASHILTGLQMFVRLNQALATVGGAAITSPPLNLSVGFPGVITVVINHVGPVYTVSPANAAGANDAPVVESTGVVNAGRKFVTSKFRFVKAFAAALAGPWACTPEITNKFGSIVLGQTWFTRASYTNFLTGAQSLPSEAQTVAI